MKKNFLTFLLGSVIFAAFSLGLSACGGDTVTEDSETLGLEYELNEDGMGYTVCGIGTSKRKNLIVPEEHKGLPVTSIAQSAFAYNEDLVSVTLSNTILSIGSYAFDSCKNIEELVISDSVVSIGAYAFYRCEGIESVFLGAGVENVDKTAFLNDNFKEYLVSENNPFLVSYKGILYTRSEPRLLSVPLAYEGAAEILEGVASIPEYAFQGRDITSVVFPESLVSIGSYAFQDCLKLTAAEFPDDLVSIGEYAFDGCNGLQTVSFPEGLSSIDSYAFKKCKALQSVTIPESVTSLGREAFSSCTGLTEIYYNAARVSSVLSVFENVGANGVSVTVGANVQAIPDYLFDYYQKVSSRIQTVRFEEGSVCQTIGECAFRNCDRLTSINLPESVKTIEHRAFENCESLESITFPENLAYVGNYAFSGCKTLSDVTVGKNVATIGDFAFSLCTGLENISVANDNPSYSSVEGNLCNKEGSLLIQYALGNKASAFTVTEGITEIGKNAFEGCKTLKEITVGDTVAAINDEAFKDCENLTAIDLSDEISTMGQSVFKSCASLKEIALPNNLSAVNHFTFDGCTSLTSVSFGANISAINSYAFTNCNALTSVSIPENIAAIEHSAFYACEALTDVSIGSGTTYVDEYAFNYCNALRSYTVSEQNSAYASHDGILYNKEKTEILLIPEDLTGEVEIPEGVASLSNSAWPFRNRENLTGIILPTTLTYIAPSCFAGCTALKKAIFKEPNGWTAAYGNAIDSELLGATTAAALCLTDTYVDYAWERK